MRHLLVGLVLAGHALVTQASEYPTDAELASALPRFCYVKLKQAGTPQEATEKARYGRENWEHIHHYCVALVNVDRARRAKTPQQSLGYLKIASDQYDYINRGFSPTFWMRPQLYVEWGSVLVKLNQHTEAVRLLGEAIRLSPTYLAAHLKLIETYKGLGMKNAALEAATAGLRQIPDSLPLQKAYLELGGEKPFPAPAPKPASERQAHEEPVTPDRSKAMPSAPASQETVADSPSGKPADEDSTQATNPERGCRFCPPDEIQKRWRESFGEPPKQQQ